MRCYHKAGFTFRKIKRSTSNFVRTPFHTPYPARYSVLHLLGVLSGGEHISEISHFARCEMKFAIVRKANISHLRSKYFTAKRFHLPEWANFVGAPALSQVPRCPAFCFTQELPQQRRPFPFPFTAGATLLGQKAEVGKGICLKVQQGSSSATAVHSLSGKQNSVASTKS